MVDISDISFRMALWDTYNKKCFFCQQLISSIDNMQVDHVIFKKIVEDKNKFDEVKNDFGLEEDFDINGYNNLVPTHPGCNRRKSDRIYYKRAMLTFLEDAKKHAPKVEKMQKELGQTITLSKLESYARITLPKVKDIKMLRGLKKKVVKYFEQAELHIIDEQKQLQRVAFSRELENDIDRYRQKTSAFSHENLLIEMDTPVNSRLISSEIYIKIIRSSNREEAIELIRKMLLYCHQRPHAIFRVSSLHVLLSLYEERLAFFSNSDLNYLKDNIEQLALYNLSYWSHDGIQNALCHYENIVLRLSKLFSMKFYMGKALNAVDLLKKEIKDKTTSGIGYTPDVAEILLYFINFFTDFYWRDFYESLSNEDIWQGFWLCQYAIDLLARSSIPSYPKGHGDLTNFENYGGTFDMYCYGTWAVLKRHNKILSDFNSQLLNFSNLSHSDVRFKIQKWKNKPKEWAPPLNQYKDTRISKLLKLLK